jgi:hypothetical protein
MKKMLERAILSVFISFVVTIVISMAAIPPGSPIVAIGFSCILSITMYALLTTAGVDK